MTRLFDFLSALVGLVILSPIFLLTSFLIAIESGFPVFYLQDRVGLKGKIFRLMKFRTMRKNSDQKGLLTVGKKDSRVTNFGFHLRKYKIDELPQLFNVIRGEMALVGPRPEVQKYVSLYNEIQKRVLEVRPGITDPASIEYMDESEILGNAEDPEKVYIEKIMPHKLELNLRYLDRRNFFSDIGIIVKTLAGIRR